MLNKIDARMVADTDGKSVSEKLGSLSDDMDSRGVSVIKYGLAGGNVFRKIKDVAPSVTLSEVQALNPSATLDNAYDWYVIQKALNNEKHIFLPGQYVIDLPLHWKQGDKKITGSLGATSIKNIGVGKPALIIGDKTASYIQGNIVSGIKITGQILAGAMSGHGIEIQNAANLTIAECIISGHGDYGLYSGLGHNLWLAKFINVRLEANKNGGAKIQHYYANQKNGVSFIGCRAQYNGYNDAGQNMYELGTATTTYGHGIEISGVAHFIGAGTDCEGNSGAGIYLGGSNVEQLINGFHISGCYFEPNRLTDIYIDNAVSAIANSFIAGNYTGGDYITDRSQKGHMYIASPKNQVNTQIVSSKYKLRGNRELHDMRIATSLYIGGEFETENLFQTDKTLYANIKGDGIKLTKDKSVLGSFIDDRDNYILFNPGIYEIQVDYYWNKITAGSTITLALKGKDYDFKDMSITTYPSKKTTNYANLVSAVNPTDTILYFDNLSGWDTATKTHMNVHDTVLSNGYAVGTDYTQTFTGLSNIRDINVTNNTVTLWTALGKTVASGTKCSLSNSGAGSFIYTTAGMDKTAQFASQKFTVDLRNIENANHHRYLALYLSLNGATDANDYLAIRRIRIKEVSVMRGTTAERPVWTTYDAGRKYFDTTLGREITWNGTKWLEYNNGSITYNGDGAALTKTIPHGLSSTPTIVSVTPNSADAGTVGIKYVTADATYLVVNFNTAPIVGTNNIKFSWRAEV